MRSLLNSILFAPVVAIACSPPPDMKPLSVEELLQGSTYVAYAEVNSVKKLGEFEVAEVRVLEQFKGETIATVISPANSCGLSLYRGEKRIFFLTEERKGHALAYPWNLSAEAILTKLRVLKS